ncbi:MAG: ABC transporter ATP-binding protein [Flavobacteriaceae bacterium]
MLTVTDLEAGYGPLKVLRQISLEVPAGKLVALLGSNGAGKTTTLKSISDIIPVTGGSVEFDGAAIQREPSHRIFARGIALVPQGRELFPDMTVEENLELGGMSHGGTSADLPQRMKGVFDQFPRLLERRTQKAGTLSGGEQQMLATGRALMSRPSLLLLDEPTTGLAPIIVHELAKICRELKSAGQTILLVEQNVRMALSVADYIYVLRNGSIVMEGPRDSISGEEDLTEAYLG